MVVMVLVNIGRIKSKVTEKFNIYRKNRSKRPFLYMKWLLFMHAAETDLVVPAVDC
jgi:hypothetical protein